MTSQNKKRLRGRTQHNAHTLITESPRIKALHNPELYQYGHWASYSRVLQDVPDVCASTRAAWASVFYAQPLPACPLEWGADPPPPQTEACTHPLDLRRQKAEVYHMVKFTSPSLTLIPTDMLV